jgi:hypothetical protein
MKQAETILKSCFLALLILTVMYISMTKNSEIQVLKKELTTTKLEAKQKCNERFLGVKK